MLPAGNGRICGTCTDIHEAGGGRQTLAASLPLCRSHRQEGSPKDRLQLEQTLPCTVGGATVTVLAAAANERQAQNIGADMCLCRKRSAHAHLVNCQQQGVDITEAALRGYYHRHHHHYYHY